MRTYHAYCGGINGSANQIGKQRLKFIEWEYRGLSACAAENPMNNWRHSAENYTVGAPGLSKLYLGVEAPSVLKQSQFQSIYCPASVSVPQSIAQSKRFVEANPLGGMNSAPPGEPAEYICLILGIERYFCPLNHSGARIRKEHASLSTLCRDCRLRNFKEG